MSLSSDEVLHLAKLAQLNLTESELAHYAEQLSPIVDYFTELNEVNTELVKETSQTTGLTDVFRPNSVDELRTLTQEQALSQSPVTYNGYIVVPAILEKE